jgi:hypothetical protein
MFTFDTHDFKLAMQEILTSIVGINLRNGNGVMIINQDELEKISVDYYIELYE